MATDLSPHNEQFIDHAIAGGLFPSRKAALDAAVDALREKQATPEPIPPEHLPLVEQALDALEEGRGVPWNPEDVKRRMQERLAKK